MLDRLEFLVGEAFSALRRNTWMTFAAVTTAAMALFLLGGMGWAFMGFTSFVKELSRKAEMKVLIKDAVPDAKARALGTAFTKIHGVTDVRFVHRDAGLKELLQQNPDLDVEGLEIDNPLPNSFIVNVTDLKVFDSVARRIQSMKEVEKNGVKFPADEQNFLADSMRLIQWLGLILGGLMLLTSGVLIYNAIRMTVLARRREIRIMQLVGATRFTVWAPMLVEGIVQGAIGGLLAALVLWSAHTVIQSTVIRALYAFGRLAPFPVQQGFLILGGVGAIYGLVCSVIAVREPLQLRRGVA